MKLQEAQLERDTGFSQVLGKEVSLEREGAQSDVFVTVLVLVFVFVVLNRVVRREESKKTKKSKISKISRHHHASNGSRKWRQVAYQHQHGINERIGKRMRAGKRAMKSGKTKKASRRLK